MQRYQLKQGKLRPDDSGEWVRFEEVRAIIDKLPKTADNVPVVPGMMIYHPDEGDFKALAWIPDGLNPRCWWVQSHSLLLASSPLYLHRCYSTREAGEAAKAELQKGKS